MIRLGLYVSIACPALVGGLVALCMFASPWFILLAAPGSFGVIAGGIWAVERWDWL